MNERRRKILKRTGAALGMVLFAGALVPLRGVWREKYGHPPLHGSLTISPSLPASITHDLGEFRLQFQGASGGRIVISHHSEPQRELFSTRVSQSFIATARGQEKVRESRGSFSFADSLSVRCANQELDRIELITDHVDLSGTLRCENGDSVGYTLRFIARSAHQLGFSLELAGADFNRTYLTYESSAGEHFYGFGEQFSYFDLKGRRVPLWVMEQGIGRGAQPITLGADLKAGAGGDWHTTYAGVPHYITSELRSLMLENNEYQVFDLRRPDEVQLEVFANGLCGRRRPRARRDRCSPG